MNPTPLEILGNPLAPDWVKRTVQEALLIDSLDAIFYLNVMLMAFRQAEQNKQLDAGARPPLKNPYSYKKKDET